MIMTMEDERAEEAEKGLRRMKKGCFVKQKHGASNVLLAEDF